MEEKAKVALVVRVRANDCGRLNVVRVGYKMYKKKMNGGMILAVNSPLRLVKKEERVKET